MEAGAPPRPGGRPGLRGLALLAGCLVLSVGSPVLPVILPLALFGLLLPGVPTRSLVLGAVLLGLALLGGGGGGLPDVDRGWTLMVAGGFVAATLTGPGRPFVERALVGVFVGAGWAFVVLAGSGGWPVLEALVAARIDAGMTATVELTQGWEGFGGGAGFRDAAQRTAEVQLFLFPAQAGLATLLGLGGAWWLHQQVSGDPLGRRAVGLGRLEDFRFPDPMIWILITGLILALGFGWGAGWGRAGANLVVFMGALLALRGAGVLLYLWGGLSWWRGLLLAVGMVLAAPVVLMGAMAVGIGDVWFDLRTRAARNAGSAPE
jgi:hypothetical protein